MDVLRLTPVPTLLDRVRSELTAAFVPERPIRVARAPGRLDIMGGIADYTGSLVLEMPLGVAAAVALQERDDDRLGVFSFNLLDEHLPFRLEVPVASLARPLDALRRDFAAPGRAWAGYLLGPLAILHDEGLLDLTKIKNGLNLAVLSTVPIGSGVSSSAALEVATMNALVTHFQIDLDPLRLAVLCQRAENEIVGAPCGVMDQIASHLGQSGEMLRMRCQPHDLLNPLPFPPGVKGIGIHTNVRHSVGGGAYGRTRAAAFMGHALILADIKRRAAESHKAMKRDPFGGYLANLDPADYKTLFRPTLPESLTGEQFQQAHGDHGDAATTLEPDRVYRVQAACDHHVLEAQRVRRFADFLERIEEIGREKALRSAGHLMYASHKSYTANAGLGAAEADVVVELVKQREASGLYGARITGGGGGGTVAILMNDTTTADAAVADLRREYESRTSLIPTLLADSSPGAAHAGTAAVGA